MRVLFRSDSSSKIGFGHIQRDLILAKQYEDVSFACLPLEGSLIDTIAYPVFRLQNSSIYELIELIKQKQFDLLILDHYDIGMQEEKLIKLQTGIQILSFDDEIKAHHCDILLNVNAYAKASDYEGLVPLNCELRCGFSYALIREEFYNEAQYIREKIFDFFICLGATDVKNLSQEIAKDLPKNTKIAIATSSSNTHLKQLKQFVAHRENIKLFVNSNNLALLMNQSSKLIITASSLVNEALLLQADFKAIMVAKNQEKLALWLEQRGVEVEYRV
ncbi:UDP-2,4-diacetamido-2,4,6-trideoxy-beta-L-altropyranose hydrolase [Campylobacter sp. MIT 21-1685]|uniref:UDP-2,4-diacetamido-2,4, 6-trideoxy-beta-L-altropyranose hydrolase n=1 Tax=unclassified Campylobacter TaxID=2593542 RepID=UPI00224A9E20|nr:MULTISPECIES: UDP-2,4-diacetamido-2,4,6-trideoxy-beta-L-altropyranose hydrolase [unclassified Campylobacter]MCX2683194.1 UDP-2,4-diacetamido-2,4,6-trideoxy-beta-L-altropyranose hydrolase [Campylobacter sp. MIT 21-1684]MCX2751486.1 UDP-2,4-diacetamido-2,4,6-trideoxy-beta-L-altropyranose hydrolase [Campylobacter sp. MIT 21-1682]MCX2807675.1 UDP-2,4-diacetamido-2,4,6-trideoxy-beta-L-altropyranose hydrolase [Campylobacter sp. MIT 21-1685]